MIKIIRNHIKKIIVSIQDAALLIHIQNLMWGLLFYTIVHQEYVFICHLFIYSRIIHSPDEFCNLVLLYKTENKVSSSLLKLTIYCRN